MATETERKFLVKGEFKRLAVKEIRITQAYLSADPKRIIRLRIADNEGFLTIKSQITGKAISRSEWEYSIPYQEAKEIMKVCLPGKIEKTRFLVPSGSHIFEVDVFHDKNEGLIVAEIELQSENDLFELPEWLGEEVTGKPEYYNVNLLK